MEELSEDIALDAWLAKHQSQDVSVLEQSGWTVDGVLGIRRIVSTTSEGFADSDGYYFKIGNRIHSINAYCFDPSLGILASVLPTVRFNVGY